MKKENFSILVSNPLDSEYIQKTAFKAGYKWAGGNPEGLGNLHEKEFIFYPNVKTMNYNDVNFPWRFNYSFPKDAVKIHEIFNTLEYKEGDYVVLMGERPERWNDCGEMDKYLGSIQCLRLDAKESVYFKAEDTKEWSFNIHCIARHATEKEIKAYKEGDDIYIGEHKVRYTDNGHIKVGCETFSNATITSLRFLIKSTKRLGCYYGINEIGISFTPKGNNPGEYYFITEKILNKILKKAGIK